MMDHKKLGVYGGYEGFDVKAMCKKNPPRFHFTPGRTYTVHCVEENVGLHPPLDVLNMEMSYRSLKDDTGKALQMKKLDFMRYFAEKA